MLSFIVAYGKSDEPIYPLVPQMFLAPRTL